MPLYLYDDARARSFEPFALTRPVSELCAGALITRQRWALRCAEPVAGAIVAEHLREFTEFEAPPAATGVIPAGSIVANARCIPVIGAAATPEAPVGDVWVCDGRVAAVRLAASLDPASCAGGHTTLETLAPSTAVRTALAGRWIDDIWGYIRDLGAQLTADILVRRGATVQAFTRVVGPCAIGEGAVVVGDRIAGSSIGERSKVHGELSTSIVMGCSNKSHD